MIAEHREITRIPNAVLQGKAVLQNIPLEFCLGKGHVRFFYNKLGFLAKRYESLYRECILRGFKVTYKGSAFKDVTYNDYIASAGDRDLIVKRITSKGFLLLDKN